MTETKITLLDLAWEQINAIGGACADSDVTGCAVNETVRQALAIIEGLGGSDPAPKRPKIEAESRGWEDFRAAAFDAWKRDNP